MNFWQMLIFTLLIAIAYYLGRYDGEYKKRIEDYIKRIEEHLKE